MGSERLIGRGIGFGRPRHVVTHGFLAGAAAPQTDGGGDMPSVIRASVNTVLTQIRAHLAAYTTVPAARIRMLARKKAMPALDGDQDILLRLRGQTPLPGHRDRHDFRVYQKVGVLLRSRNELDEADSDDVWLRQQVTFDEDVIDAMQNFIPEDDGRNVLVWEAVKYLGSVEQEAEGDGWGSTELFFQFPVILPLDFRRHQ